MYSFVDVLIPCGEVQNIRDTFQQIVIQIQHYKLYTSKYSKSTSDMLII